MIEFGVILHKCQFDIDLVLSHLVCPVILDNVPQVVLGVVEKQPDFAIGVVEKDALQRDDVRMFQLAQQRNLAAGRH